MNLIDLSKEQDVGASSLYVEIGPFKVLIDAGFHPKYAGNEAVPDFDKIDNFSLDFIVLTHCHLDHLGALPIIYKKQTQAEILTSLPSMTLAPRLLRNSYQVMLRQRDEQGILECPLYTKGDIDQVERALLSMPYGMTRTFEKEGESLDVTFYNAGHVPGGSGCLFKYKHRKIFFTGDVLFENQKIIPGADFPKEQLDTLVVETTRGATERVAEKSRKNEVNRLIETISHTLDRKGSCLIPAFALGRMQEILSILHEAKKQGRLPECPIYCSGLGLDLVDYFEVIAKKTGLVHFRKKILKDLKVRSFKKKIYPGEDIPEKGIYVLSSGMLVEWTPAYMAAASLLDHHPNSICFVGYCDPETPGGKILAAHHEDHFVFEPLDHVAKVKASIEKFDLTGHAEREELLDYALSTNPRAVVLTHGEKEAREWFEESFAMEEPGMKVINPIPGKNYLV